MLKHPIESWNTTFLGVQLTMHWSSQGKLYDNDIHSPHPGVWWELTDSWQQAWNHGMEWADKSICAGHTCTALSCYHGDDLEMWPLYWPHCTIYTHINHCTCILYIEPHTHTHRTHHVMCECAYRRGVSGVYMFIYCYSACEPRPQ